jgi:hypothetical protein
MVSGGTTWISAGTGRGLGARSRMESTGRQANKVERVVIWDSLDCKVE